MKEDEAKQKWCPFVRASTFHDKTWNNRGNDYHHQQCIASGCMAWRWDYTQAGINYGAGELPTRGFCGLAGKP